ncbi:SDR family oxidoreductase [Paraburkholderia sp. BL25I1N1]|uniref:dTDP-4-dehydrorhamnose reductase family protein n=1 Tax=Paraburkholderia sp. BL25I1N1 TaxID=1938804 RepID=UPI000D085131|nr:SDR family oxidoreductase [Paraburkholderia sp. BL25I1N1]PRX98293.1 dTDP-4-dehydrorhamnose reductase [Paraburkholderia sp. BL25I1N1]
MFKIAVIGASGLLGRALVDELAQPTGWQVVATAFSRPAPGKVALDIRDTRAVEQFVEHEAPDALVIAAAERRPDVCEHDPALARALNVDAVRTLATSANRRGAWTLSISTDYVFDGTHPPYQHDSVPAPLNAYGHSKLEGERALTESTDLGCVLRLPLLYGPIVSWAESAVTSLVPAIAGSAATGSKPAVMDAWAIRYPTFTPDVAFVIRQMLERHAQGDAIRGIVQWSGDEPMNKYEIALRLAEALQLDAHLTPQPVPTDSTPRPHNCHLASTRLEALGIGRRTPFDTAIRQVLAAFPWRGAAQA